MIRLALAALLLLAAASTRAATAAGEAWFRLPSEIEAAWSIEPIAGDRNRLLVRERQRSGDAGRRVTVLYPRASTAYDVAIGALIGTLQERDIDLRLTVVNFDRDDARGRAALAAAEADGTELIVAMGSESTAWLDEHYRGGRLPVVTVCSKDPVELKQIAGYDQGSGSNFAFTSLNMPVEAQFAYLMELRPGLKSIAVLVDAQNKSAVRTQSRPLLQLAQRRGIAAIEVAVEDPAQAAVELTRLVPAAVATMRKSDPELTDSLFWITGSTSVFREIAVVNAGADRVPVLSAVPDVVQAEGRGAAMSIGVSFESNAQLAALYAADILTGRAKPGALKVGVVSPPDIAVDFRRTREIGFKVPFGFFERATTIYDAEGRLARAAGKRVGNGT